MGKISSYTRALVAKLQDVFVVDQTDNNVTSTKSVTVEQIGDTIAGTQVHSTLTTSDKTLIGAIKEVAKDKNIADEYDDTHTYNIGDITIYGNTLYICTANNTTGDFDPSKWTATTIDNVIGSLSSLTTTVQSSLVGAVNELDSKFSSLLKVANCTTTYTVSANSSVNVDDSFITNQTPSGYSYVGVVGFSTNDVNAVVVSLRPFNSGVYAIQIKNIGSTALSNKTLLCQCLFIKTGGI